MKLLQVPTPAYIIDEGRLEKNLQILANYVLETLVTLEV